MGGVGGDDLTGARLGPYLLEAPLGDGPFGRRYRARHVALDSPRLVEVREAAAGADPGFQEAARAAARQEHPDAAAVLDFGAEGTLEYLVTDPPVADPPEAPAERGPAPPVRRPPVSRLVTVAAAVLVGTGVVVAVVGGKPPTASSNPATAPAAVGEPMLAGGLAVTVLSVDVDAAPPAALRVDAGDRFVAVVVRCQDAGSAPAPVSPYDWVVSDAEGGAYDAVADSLDGALAQRVLAPGQSAQGRIGFVVPRSAPGLRLHFDAERDDGSAQLPLT